MRAWLLSLCAAGLLAGFCTAMAPEGGRKTVKMAGGLLLLLAAILPFRSLSGFSPQAELAILTNRLQKSLAAPAQQTLDEMRALVEDQCAAFLLSRAAEQGLSCTVAVAARIDDQGVLRAYSVTVNYRPPLPTAEQTAEMQSFIEHALGIPPGRQRHR